MYWWANQCSCVDNVCRHHKWNWIFYFLVVVLKKKTNLILMAFSVAKKPSLLFWFLFLMFNTHFRFVKFSLKCLFFNTFSCSLVKFVCYSVIEKKGVQISISLMLEFEHKTNNIQIHDDVYEFCLLTTQNLYNVMS